MKKGLRNPQSSGSEVSNCSDELYDHICGPCFKGDESKEAKHYCRECKDYLCEVCKEYHRKLAVTKNHRLLSGRDIPHFPSIDPDLLILCKECDKSLNAESYCEDHLKPVCMPCSSFEHHKCKISSLQGKWSSYETISFVSVLSKTKVLKEKFDRLKQKSQGYGNELELLKDTCKEEIKTFRRELDTFLNKLEKDMLAELDNDTHVQKLRIADHISVVTTALEMLDSDYQLLKDAEQDGKKESMFKSDLQVAKDLELCERRLADLMKVDVKPSLSFERNQKLSSLQKDITRFGSLTRDKIPFGYHSYGEQKEAGNCRDKKVLLGRKIQTYLKISARTEEDFYNPLISGGTVMPNCCVVLCDRSNYKIKLLDSSWVLTRSMAFPDLWDVSAVDPHNILVTLPIAKQLQFVQLFPQMKAGRVIQLDKKCWGVEVSRNEIYITCHNDPFEGEIRILDLNGNIRRRLGVTQGGAFMFVSPNFITVSETSEKVFISDERTSIITCMTAAGRISYQYRDNDMKSPKGLYCDSGDNILICSWGSHNVQVITSEGKKDSTLSYKDGLNYPSPIVFRQSNETVIIGCVVFDNMQLLKLEE